MFRLMDPDSQRMMGLRTDITLQVARIARSRLKDAARPLRLSYAGEVLRVSGAQLRPERQFAQAGVELIGTDAAGADAEIVLLAAEAMTALGISDFSVDLTHPLLAQAVAKSKGLDAGAVAAARLALDRKDAAELAKVGGPAADLLSALLRCAGPAGPAMKELLALDLPEPAAAMARELDSLARALQTARPDLTLTVDPCEFRGFEYHTGITFSVFSPHVRGELAGGGRYRVGASATEDGEPATGLTLYMESIMRGLAPAKSDPAIYVPFGVSYADTSRLRAQNWAAIQGLAPEADPADDRAEAKRLGCTHWFDRGKIKEISV
jgi:ATP phosphoribosyltransferase regulatory subunit